MRLCFQWQNGWSRVSTRATYFGSVCLPHCRTRQHPKICHVSWAWLSSTLIWNQQTSMKWLTNISAWILCGQVWQSPHRRTLKSHNNKFWVLSPRPAFIFQQAFASAQMPLSVLSTSRFKIRTVSLPCASPIRIRVNTYSNRNGVFQRNLHTKHTTFSKLFSIKSASSADCSSRLVKQPRRILRSSISFHQLHQSVMYSTRFYSATQSTLTLPGT